MSQFFKEEEFYVSIYSHRFADTILFYHEGGVDVGDVDAKVCVDCLNSFVSQFYLCLQACKLDVPVDRQLSKDQVKKALLKEIKDSSKIE